jgi:hypothetical protein
MTINYLISCACKPIRNRPGTFESVPQTYLRVFLFSCRTYSLYTNMLNLHPVLKLQLQDEVQCYAILFYKDMHMSTILAFELLWRYDSSFS